MNRLKGCNLLGFLNKRFKMYGSIYIIDIF
nr:MAG TPA: hypothetical protein [Caudoviricetes sp.]DAZ34573.1 MAG TPA: hypothetical protein [Caudoviricetes sp.]